MNVQTDIEWAPVDEDTEEARRGNERRRRIEEALASLGRTMEENRQIALAKAPPRRRRQERRPTGTHDEQSFLERD